MNGTFTVKRAILAEEAADCRRADHVGWMIEKRNKTTEYGQMGPISEASA